MMTMMMMMNFVKRHNMHNFDQEYLKEIDAVNLNLGLYNLVRILYKQA